MAVFRQQANLRFLRIVVVVLPASLLLTAVWKQVMIVSLSASTWNSVPSWSSEDEGPLPQAVRVHYYAGTSRDTCLQRDTLAAVAKGLKASAWISETDCCSWPGVSCVDGLVTHLSITAITDTPHVLGSGTLPVQVSSLRSLQVLDMNGCNGISGTLPNGLMNLPRLSHLYSFGTRLSGDTAFARFRANFSAVLKLFILDASFRGLIFEGIHSSHEVVQWPRLLQLSTVT
mmetsp:Transcript_35804/g.75246  ORF Transcript_35804/g.75246 Transcript_35804/m.75246 type:complete len:230 (+) Transcript_35804:291-980(+)